jgi:SAM-dependent methyltransferase
MHPQKLGLRPKTSKVKLGRQSPRRLWKISKEQPGPRVRNLSPKEQSLQKVTADNTNLNMPNTSIYQTDVAYIHHVGFGGYARKAAPGVLRILKRAGVQSGRLLDLACGSGIWARVAQRSGFEVIGVDSSHAMIRMARGMLPGAKLICRSMLDLAPPACDAVTCIGEGINYALASRSPAGRAGAIRVLLALLRRIHAALRPGGILIFDMMIAEGDLMNYRSWQAGDDWAVLFEISEPRPHQALLRRNTTFRRTSSGYRRRNETHCVCLLPQKQIERALRRAGFYCSVKSSYGDFPLPQRRRAFVATKPT